MGKVLTALNKALAEGGDPEGLTRVAAAPLTTDSPPRVSPMPAPVDTIATPGPSVGGPSSPSRESAPEAENWGEQWDEKLVAFSDPTSAMAENFRLLRSQVLHPSSGRPYKKILITSTEPGSGKSFVTANLGISLAQGLDQHALLVDCDLRRSRLASLFHCPGGRGLVNYLRDHEDLGSLILKTGMRKLSLIPSGPRPHNPAELLGSARVEAMFAELSSRYDDRFILIDTPPTQAASETAVLAQHVDGVILVVRWGGGAREPLKQLVDSLGREKIIGIVFNAYESHVLSAKVTGYDEYGQYTGSYGGNGGS